MSTVPYKFTPGIDSTVYLPIDGSSVTYTATLDAGLTGPKTIAPCYDKYGALWKWSTFERNSLTGVGGLSAQRAAVLNTTTGVTFPSSWASVASTAAFPKKWRNLNTTEFNNRTISKLDYFYANAYACSALGIWWSLSSTNWLNTKKTAPLIVPQFIPITTSNSFNFKLKLKDYGTELYTGSVYDDIIITLNASVSGLGCNGQPGYLQDSFDILVVAPPKVKLYTPNKYVLTGTNVFIENLLTHSESIASLTANCDDNKIIVLKGKDVTNNFSLKYDIPGYKTITITTEFNKAHYNHEPVTTVFTDMINVLTHYDDVYEENYRTIFNSVIKLPYPTQPKVGSNDWVTADNINLCFNKFYKNLEYLDILGRTYNDTYTNYYGYLGVGSTITGNTTAYSPWTWEDVNCLVTELPYTVTWADLLSSSDNITPSGYYVTINNATWKSQKRVIIISDPSATGKYCISWNWRSRKIENTIVPLTWKQTKEGNQYQKQWRYEPCEAAAGTNVSICDEGVWNVNIPGIDTYYQPTSLPYTQTRCLYSSIVSKNNILYVSQKKQLNVISPNYTASLTAIRNTSDDVIEFSNIKDVCIDSQDKIYILDSNLSQIFVYNTNITNLKEAPLYTSWGGVGGANSNTKFSYPNDLHIDQLDNVWVCDTGNSVIKQYTNTGSWLNTIKDDVFSISPPLSLAVDSKSQLHVLTKNGVRVYTYTGELLFTYSFNEYIDTDTPLKLTSSYNREIIYISTKTKLLKFFRNGIFNGYIIQSKNYINNITNMYHDEFRNLLVTVNDRVYLYNDLMTLKHLKGTLPNDYWSFNDIAIHENEYIQNWVYTKSFQRLWDNIETFRNTLYYENNFCKSYSAPVYDKSKMIIGQNEIVTSTVINRVLGYLWDNFYSLVKYFDKSCKEIVQVNLVNGVPANTNNLDNINNNNNNNVFEQPISLIYGCTDPAANNYNPNATVNDGSCDYSIYGCTDPIATNYNPNATKDNGTCSYIYGCTDPAASNYNPNATVDNGSCDYSIYGCTNSYAANYNPNATKDDGSCKYGFQFNGEVYKYLVVTDWDNCLMSPNAPIADTFVADDIRYTSYPWPNTAWDETIYFSNVVDGHTVWEAQNNGTAICIRATGNYVDGNNNYSGINFVGQVKTIEELSQFVAGCPGVGCCPETPPNGDYTALNQPGTVICNTYSPDYQATTLVNTSYTSFEGVTKSMTAYQGRNLALQIYPTFTVKKSVMDYIVGKLDLAYDFYYNVIKEHPLNDKVLNGRATMSVVDSTCGAGCGYLGATGIEMLVSTWNTLYNGVTANNQFDQVLFYELGRNFWVDSIKKIECTPGGIITTGYAVFMRFMAMTYASVSGGPFNGNTFTSLKDEVKGLLTTYINNPSYNWTNTVYAGVAPTNTMGLGGTDMWASFMFDLYNRFNFKFLYNVWYNIKNTNFTNGTDIENANSIFVIAASKAVGYNLYNLFKDYYRWPLYSDLTTELEGYEIYTDY